MIPAVILAFGIVLTGVFLLLVFLIPNPTQFQYSVLRILLAVVCAAVATALTGFLEIQMQVPLSIKAGGPLAVFIIVYFFAPAAVRQAQEVLTNRKSNDPKVGDQVQVRAGGQNDVTVPGKGLIGWTDEMTKYRGTSGKITQVERVFEVPVYRLNLDGGTHQWHRNWFEIVD